ncbi:glycoside hydrolase family 95 protein [Ginsengibacter hankyongi]|uniref:Glycoside hydrolase family 95 protein n=1 Tax=Ginsengibacter hankyongi TaxID=2607284 RepID=A0A5J5II31_9BACT|nr:glycoside hydrolase family 95 protein [Ginsengibacter hankyongi]KAA9040556.1 glycoside hydrolase family 95 protein [Ginsengibacter hankyongi]
MNKPAHRLLFLGVIFLLLNAGLQGQVTKPIPVAMKFNIPANNWLEALPLGNGFLGAMVFGGANHERIQFNESSLITGTTNKVGYYQPFGNVLINFNHGEVVGYHRELLLNEGVHKISYSAGKNKFYRTYFISNPDRVMVMKYTSQGNAKISCKIMLNDAHQSKTIVNGSKLIFKGKLLENNMEYEAQLLVKLKGGRMTEDSTGIEVKNANEIELYLVAGTSFVNDPLVQFKGEAPHNKLEQQLLGAVTKTYAQLFASHVTDFSRLFNKVELKLGKQNNLDITERFTAYNKGAIDPDFEALLFQYGRYLLISSSRPGGLPANLQGIWNDEFKPAWYAQYTTNINVEMNYWLAEPTGLSECHLPLFDWIEHIGYIQKKSTDSALKTKKGWIIYNTNNIMGGPSAWRIHRPGSAWLSQHLWEHVAFTNDTAFLRKRAYPLLKEITEYWEDHLVEGPNHKLITPYGWSPEHGPGKNEGDKSPYPGASYDQQIVYDLFGNYIAAATKLGIDQAYCAKITSMQKRLLGPQVGRWGQLQEWMDDVDDSTDHHRHNSHLFAVYPGKQISPIYTPDWARAAKKSLDSRGNVSTGWSTAWKMNIYARLLEGNKAYQLLRTLLKPVPVERSGFSFDGGLYPNLFDAHTPFQIDGNFGYTAAVVEMLLQSHLGEIHLLPALPDAWQEGSVKGLIARGNVRVDITWKKGNLENVIFKAAENATAKIRYGQLVKEIYLVAGKEYVLNQELNKINKSYVEK